jgi:hypothetical protein
VPLRYVDVGISQSGTRWDAMCRGIRVAHISKNVLSITAGRAVTWAWTIYLSTAPDGLPRHGNAESFEQAKGQVDKAWQAWLDAAGLCERSG